MFTKKGDGGFREMIPGVRLRTAAHGERTLLGEFRIDRGAVIPSHHHPYEQTGVLISGRLDFVIGGEAHTAEPGDCWCIASDVEHSAVALEDTVVVEVFSPLREEYLP